MTKFWPDGTLAYSVLIGGEAANTATGIAVDSGENAYLIGNTNSVKFPVTPGALVSQLSAASYTGFLVKLSATGAEVGGTYLGASDVFANSIVVGSDGHPILAGTGGPPGLPPPPQGTNPAFLLKLDPTASQAVAETYLPGSAAALVSDNQGNLFLAGSLPATPGAYVSPPSHSGCGAGLTNLYPNTVSITKLTADWQPVYTALLNAPCGIRLGAMAADDVGAAIVPLATGPGFPLHNPLLAGPTCYGLNASAIAKLSPDGSALEFATYLDDCGVPALALGVDGSLYAGVSSAPAPASGPAGVLHLSAANPPPISLDWISNAFSGDSSAIAAGGLYTITGTGASIPARIYPRNWEGFK